MNYKNNKHTLYVMSIIIIGFLLYVPSVQANSIEYEDYSEQHTYPNEILEEHITVYSKDGQYNKEEVQKSIDILEKLPSHTFEIIEAKDIHLYFIDFPLPDLKGMEDLDEEEIVPGYPEGSTYRDDVFGVYYPKEKWSVVRTDLEAPYSSEIVPTTLHEIGHALSYSGGLADYFSSPEFYDIRVEEKKLLYPDNSYYDDNGEYFAEVFAYYFLNEETNRKLKEKAPRTLKYMDDFINYSFYASENTVDAVTLTWVEIEEAASYELMRDGVILDNVTDTTYVDQDYDEYSHEYEVKAIDEDGKQVFEFLKETVETKLYDKQNIELDEKIERESQEFRERMENTTTLEDVLDKLNIPSDFLPIIFWTILIFVLIILPITVIGLIYFLIRRKRKKHTKEVNIEKEG